MFCKYCGTQMADDVKFCPSCGAPVSTPSPQQATPGSDYSEPVTSAASISQQMEQAQAAMQQAGPAMQAQHVNNYDAVGTGDASGLIHKAGKGVAIVLAMLTFLGLVLMELDSFSTILNSMNGGY